MSLLSYSALVDLVKDGVITADLSQVNGASIDLTLDSIIRVEERNSGPCNIITLANKENIETKEVDITDTGFCLHPDQFILASSREFFNLPNNISAEYKLKSSMARNGLEHLNAGWADATWHGSKLTLELKNMTVYHELRLTAGMKIGQMVFFEHEPVPDHASYALNGQYNNQTKVTAAKGLR